MAGDAARGALEPGEGGPGVDQHDVGLGRRAEVDTGDVVADADGIARGEGDGDGGWPEERGHGLGHGLGQPGGERSDAGLVVGEDGGEGKVGEGGRGAGAPGVMESEVEARAVEVAEWICVWTGKSTHSKYHVSQYKQS